MKRIRNILTISLTGILLLLVAASCDVDNNINGEDLGENALKINLSFTPNESNTRATEDGDYDGTFNEDVISSLDIFIYDGNTLKWKIGSSDLFYDQIAKQATIPVSQDKRSLFINNTSQSYDVYVVANNTADLSTISEEDDNLDELKNLVFQSSEFGAKGGLQPQSNFVMDGNFSKVINLNNPILGTVNMKRAASKIRFRLSGVNVPGYAQDGTPQVRLIHYTDKSALLDGGVFALNNSDLKDVQARNLSSDAPTDVGGGKTTAAPLYAYANNWQMDNSKETYLELIIPLKDDENNITKPYRYKVPITPKGLTGTDAQYMNRLDRNFLYDVSAVVKVLGSIDEPPVEIDGNYIIKDWSTHEILVDIKASHYLVVSEHRVVMPNINSYTITFNSSIPNVTLVSNSLKATYTYVNVATGNPVTGNITSGPQMPSVTVQPNTSAGTITITSAIPVNFIPKDIEFKITNGQLTETIIVEQLPQTYYTVEKGVKSNLRNQLESAHTNPYMYTITTLAPSGDLIWGFPPLNSNGDTENSATTANMISPRFMMASQFGATSPMNYNNGVTNCRNYWEETVIGGQTIRYDDWRLPTEAEIKYIDDLQHNTNNPQGIVMRGNYYWDAYSGNNAYKMKNPVTSSASASSAHVRCIRDIKD